MRGISKPPPEIAKDMRDPPELAQANSFFRCLFGHDLKKLKDEYNAEKNASIAKNKKILKPKPQMGCAVCNAQIY